MKRLFAVLTALLMAVVMGFTLIGCIGGATEEAKASSYVSVDINPSIELTLDQNDKVISVRGANEDGQVLLYGETGLVGVDVQTAIAKITDLAVELGYLSEDNKVVGTSVSTKDQAKKEKLLNKINAKIVATAGKAELTVKTDGNAAYSLLRKFEQFKQEHPEFAENLEIDKFKLAVSASQTGEVTLEAAVELSEEELIKIISEAHKNMKDYATDAYNKAMAKAQADYDKAVGEMTDVIYLAKGEGLDGAMFMMYKTLARTLNGVANMLMFVEDVNEYELTEEQVLALTTALELEETEIAKLKNSDGKITLESIYAYIDKTVKNFEDQEIAKEFTDKIENSLTALEGDILALINQFAIEYKDEIETAITTIKENPLIAANQELSELIADIEQAINDDDGITFEEIRELADKFEEKAEYYKKKIDAGLTEKDRKQIKDAEKLAKDSMGAVIENMENHRDQARQKLENLKADRKPDRK